MFGKKIRKRIADTIKSKRETREIFTHSEKTFPWTPSYPSRRNEFVSPKAEDRITENSIMVASFINRHKKVNKVMVNIHSSSRTFFNLLQFQE